MHKSRLTFYIFIALILGVVAGYVYNVYVIGEINNRISNADANIKSISTRLVNLSDTTTVDYKSLKVQRAAQAVIRSQNDAQRDDRLEGFTILSDIFLRLIKMI